MNWRTVLLALAIALLIYGFAVLVLHIPAPVPGWVAVFTFMAVLVINWPVN